MRYDYSSIGFITFDCLCWPFTEVPPGGGCNIVEEFTLAVSGAAGTAVIAAAKMGLNCLAVGGVGEDLMGDWVLKRLSAFGVDISAMQRKPEWRTSSSIVTTRADGSRPALHMNGATRDFYVDDAMMSQVIDASVVHLGGVGLMKAMDQGRNRELAKRAKARGAVTTVDVFAGSPDDLPAIADVLPYTDYFMPSIEEAQALTGRGDAGDMSKVFLDMGVNCCIFTLGAEGAYYRHRDGTTFRIPAFDIAVKCTCGCGDAFNAGFAVATRKGFNPEDTVRFAQATSALNATGLGSQAGVKSFDHTIEFMNTTKTRQ
ncbi:MAG: kinase [Rhizobiales bacterium]|nr:kinase [Hyphomicrobiales bacterium]